MGVRRGIDRKKVGCRSLIDANLEGQVGVNKFELYFYLNVLFMCSYGDVMYNAIEYVYIKIDVKLNTKKVQVSSLS